ncbi:MAG: hypothetical protein ACRERC_08895, partial [Candidatus Binatia bacterium]
MTIVLAVSARPATAREVAYVAHPGDDSVSVVDLDTGVLTARIVLGDATAPTGFALRPGGVGLVALNGDAGTLALLDPATLAVQAVVPTGGQASAIAFHPDGDRAYLTGYGCSVSVVSLSQRRVLDTIPTGYNSRALALTADGGQLYVATDREVIVIDTARQTIVAALPTDGVESLHLSPDGRTVFALGPYYAAPLLIDTDTFEVHTLDDPRGDALAFAGAQRAYLRTYDGLAVIDTADRSVRSLIPLSGIGKLAAAPDGRSIYAINVLYADDGIHVRLNVVDTASDRVTAGIDLAQWVDAITVSADGRSLFLAQSGAVAVFDTATLEERDSVLDAPASELLSGPAAVYALGNGAISAIDPAALRRVARTAGAQPVAIAASADGRTVAIANQRSDRVAIVDSATNLVTATIAVGDAPLGVAVSPDGARAYVLHYNAVSMIDVASSAIVLTAPGLCDDYTAARAFALSADGTRLLVLFGGDYTRLVALDAATLAVAQSFTLDDDSPRGLAISADGRTAFVGASTVFGGAQLLVVDVPRETVRRRIDLAALPLAIAFDDQRNRAYATLGYDGSIAVVDPAAGELEQSIDMTGPAAVAVLGTHAVVAQPGANALTVIATGQWQVTSTIALHAPPGALAVAEVAAASPPPATATPPPTPTPAAQRSLAFVGADDGRLYVIDLQQRTVTATLDLGRGAQLEAIGLSPDGRTALVADSHRSFVYAVDTVANRLRGSIVVGAQPS